MRNHRSKRTYDKDEVEFRWSVEPLERRELLAGMVDGVVRGATLRLTGDELANSIVISSSGGQVQVAGSGTDVNIEGDLSRVQKIIYASGDGNDVTVLQNLELSRSVSIDSSSGNVSVIVAGATEIRRLTTTAVAGNSDFVMRDTASVRGAVTHKTTNGDSSTIVQDQAVIGGLLKSQTTDGASNVRLIDDSSVARYKGSGFETIRNVVYATQDSGDLKADVYIPKTDGPHPGILVIHGGFWRTGSKAAMTGRAKKLADRGYVVVNINYRLAPDHLMPAMIHDVKSAIIWMRQNAAEYGIDPDRIGTYGYSAGGHLALMLGVTDGSEGLEGPDADGTSTRVQAVVAGGPATDFRNLDANSTQFEYLFGGTRSELPAAYAAASPAHWVTSDDTPTLIYRGTNDSVINQDNLNAFTQSLDTAGVANRVVDIEGATHLSTIRNKHALMESLRFFDEQLKG